jgi:hypothetical protein
MAISGMTNRLWSMRSAHPVHGCYLSRSPRPKKRILSTSGANNSVLILSWAWAVLLMWWPVRSVARRSGCKMPGWSGFTAYYKSLAGCGNAICRPTVSLPGYCSKKNSGAKCCVKCRAGACTGISCLMGMELLCRVGRTFRVTFIDMPARCRSILF